MINKLGFGFLRLPKKDGELDWQTICSMVDVFMDGGGVSDCIGCHSCEKHCSQKLTIAEHMKTIAQKFETSEA